MFIPSNVVGYCFLVRLKTLRNLFGDKATLLIFFPLYVFVVVSMPPFTSSSLVNSLLRSFFICFTHPSCLDFFGICAWFSSKNSLSSALIEAIENGGMDGGGAESAIIGYNADVEFSK